MSFQVAGVAYDRFMGRYSRLLARSLTEALGVAPGQRVLDVGCGPGIWTEQLRDVLGADGVCAVDPSGPFVEEAKQRLPDVDIRQNGAQHLPWPGGTFDATGANLVAHFIPDPPAGVREMARVTRPGGPVGATTWDLLGGRTPMASVFEALAQVQPGAVGEPGHPVGNGAELTEVLVAGGLADVDVSEVEVRLTHPTFEEFWEPYLHGVGPVGESLAALEWDDLKRVEGLLRERWGVGPFEITAVAFLGVGRAG